MQIIKTVVSACQTNCYLLWGEQSETCAVIDPGDGPEQVLQAAAQQGKRIEAILLTHAHFDHVGGVRAIAEQTGCRVFLCTADCAMPQQLTAGPLYYTDAYGEGSTLQLAGLGIRVMHTPGHTPGSVCLLADGALFSGDTLFADSCGRTDLPGGSWTQLAQSLKRLRDIRGDWQVYPGHGPATTLARERQYNPYLQ